MNALGIREKWDKLDEPSRPSMDFEFILFLNEIFMYS